MALPKIAIVGRPNVGKSSLFNWLAGKRISIVDPTPGVTRDRITAPVLVGERYIELTDTGGMGIEDRDNLTEDVERQIRLALEQACAVLFLVDSRTGPVPLDDHVAQKLRGLNKPTLLVANKCDHEGIEPQAAEFFSLGFGAPLCVSAQQNRGRAELMAWLGAHLPAEGAEETPGLDDAIKIALVGRRNTGKSTFINCLAQEERTIVSEVEGTTRDSVDVHFERDGKTVIAIDTAGVRYRGKVKDDIDFYSLTRAERSIRRADVVLHFLESAKRISIVDKQLAAYVLEEYKPVIFVINKWDLAKEHIDTGEYAEYLHRVFPSLDYVPIAFTTAKDGKNVHRVIQLARSLHKQAGARVGTGDLNRAVKEAMTLQPPSMRMNRVAKVYYATQVATNPPTIVLFTNGPELLDNTYRRYLLKYFRDHLPFGEVAIKLLLRDKRQGDGVEEGRKSARVRAAKKRKEAAEPGELWEV